MPLVGKMSEQQRSVYDAQAHVTQWRQFVDVTEIQTWCDELTSSTWWEQKWPHVVRVEAHTHGSTKCSVGYFDESNHCGIIQIAPNMRNARTVLHEIAHCIMPKNNHDAVWARTFLELTYYALGSDSYVELQSAFSSGNVDIG